jgi:hypothetical protein
MAVKIFKTGSAQFLLAKGNNWVSGGKWNNILRFKSIASARKYSKMFFKQPAKYQGIFRG